MSTFDLSTSTASTLSAVDLSKLPFPEFLADKDYESILAEMIADVNNFCVEKTGQSYIAHEADPAYIVIEACAYRRWMDIKDYQAQVKNNLVAYATGEWLDHLGSNPDFKCPRLTIVPANDTTTPPTEAVMESDDAYRARLVLTNEGYTTAGSAGSYLFHALSADGDVRDAAVIETGNEDGTLTIAILSHSNGWQASTELVAKVQAALSAQTVRPLNDKPTVIAGSILDQNIRAALTFYPGAETSSVMQNARESLNQYTAEHSRLGHDLTLAGITAALMVTGVQNVHLLSPTSDLVADETTVFRCVDIALEFAGVEL